MSDHSNKSEICLLLIPFLILGCLRLAGFDGMVGQDGYAYADYAKRIREAWLGGAHPGDFFWPPGYPILGALLSFTGFPVPLSLQLISCLSLSGTLILVGRFIKRTYPQSSHQSIFAYLVLFGLCAPYFFRNGMVTTSDMAACFMVSMSLNYGSRYVQNYKWIDLILVAFSVSFGTLIRYPVAVLLAPWVLYLAWKGIRYGKNTWHYLAVFIPLAVVALYIWFKPDYTAFLQHRALTSWNFANYFTGSFSTTEGYTRHLLPNLVFVFSPLFHPGWILPGLVFLFWTFKSGERLSGMFPFVILPYLTFGLFLAGYQDQNPRHLLIGFPMILFCCFHGFDHYFGLFRERKFFIPLMILIGMVQVLLSARALKSGFLRNALERKVTERLRLLEGKTQVPVLYGFDMDIALASRGVPFEVRSLFREEYAGFERGALVLFNEKALSGQWKGKNPMINWEKLKNNYTLRSMETFDRGWQLYSIE